MQMQKKIKIGNIKLNMYFTHKISAIREPEILMEKLQICKEEKLILHRSEILLCKNILELFLQNKLSGIESSYFVVCPVSFEKRIIRYDIKLLFNSKNILLDKLMCKNIVSVISKYNIYL